MPAETSHSQAPPPPGAFHILVVDSEDGERDALCRLIEREGYRVTGVATSQEALDLLKKTPVNLVVTDLLMPDSDISGWDLLEVVKQDHPRIRVVVMTGQVSKQGEAVLTDRRADGYLIKPVISQRLRILFRALLSPFNLGRQVEVVVVDKDHESTRQIENALSERGIYAISFDDTRKAFRHIRDEHPDLVIVELALGKESGFDLCRFIRFTPGIAYTPILLVASRASRETVARAVRLRLNGILLKPFQMEEFVKRAIHLLRQATQPRKTRA